MEDCKGRAPHLFPPATTSKRGSHICPSCQSCWVCPELRCSVIVSVDVTPHRFILIRSGMRIPSASLYHHHLPQMPRTPRTTTKAVHWKVPRVQVLERLLTRLEKRMEALQRVKLDGFQMVVSEMEVEMDYLRRAKRQYLEE